MTQTKMYLYYISVIYYVHQNSKPQIACKINLFSCKKIGGAKLYWNKCILRCESTQHNPNKNNLSIFKDNQQKFVEKLHDIMITIVAVGFASVFTEFIFLDLYFCFCLFLFKNELFNYADQTVLTQDGHGLSVWFIQTNFYDLLSGHFA